MIGTQPQVILKSLSSRGRSICLQQTEPIASQAVSHYCFIPRPPAPCAPPAPYGPGPAPAALAPYLPLGRLQFLGKRGYPLLEDPRAVMLDALRIRFAVEFNGQSNYVQRPQRTMCSGHKELCAVATKNYVQWPRRTMCQSRKRLDVDVGANADTQERGR